MLLLAYLALEPHKPHRRDELAALLYPDHSEKQASVNLRQTLLRLRRAIGDETAPQPYLLNSPLTLQFDATSASWLDVTEFETIIAAVQRHRHRRLQTCRDCIAQLAQAAALYRGDFLAGMGLHQDFPYVDWLQTIRSDLHQKAAWALRTLGLYYLRYQQFDESAACVARLMQMDALDEEALRIEMHILALKGQRNQALQRYHEFKGKLMVTLEVTPEPDTLKLAQALRTGQSPHNQQAKKQRKDTLLTLQDFSPTALPNTLLPFVGRQAELAQITKLLSSLDTRLITLTGPGGIGKTRLAMRAAADDALAWEDGVWLALLDDSSAGYDLEDSLIKVLGIPVREGGQRRSHIFDFLREKELLLLLDNFERMIERADLVKSLLDHAPRLKVIATSRQRLGIRGEQVIDLHGLDFPHANDQSNLDQFEAAYSAVRLFAESVRRVDPGFTLKPENVRAVVGICQQVDGLPLGIELASAWMRIFPCEDILERIEQNVDFLRSADRDVPPRHVSLRAVFEYSWRLLTPEERQLLVKIAACENGATPDQMTELVNHDVRLLAALRDKSLLQELPGGRLGLHPLLRPYAAEKHL